jgi:uncharacterized protein YjbI with pentapeptide repeats
MNDLRVGPGALVALAAVAVGLIGVNGCQSSGTQIPATVEAPEPVALTERDIADNRAYFASTKETLFFSLESADGEGDPAAGDTGGKGYDVSPFLVDEAQTLSLCADKGDERYEVEIDQGGEAVLHVSAGDCATATLTPGSYELKLTRDPRAGRASPMPMFVHSVADASQCPTDVDPFADYENLWMLTAERGTVWGRRGTDGGEVSYIAPENTYLISSAYFEPALGIRFKRLDAPSDSIAMFSDKGLPAVAIGSEPPLQIAAGGPLTWLNTSTAGTPDGGYDGATPQLFQPVGGTWSFWPRALVRGAQYAWMDAHVTSSTSVFIGTPSVVGAAPTPFSVTLAMRAYPLPMGADAKPVGIGEVSFAPTTQATFYPYYVPSAYVMNDSNAFPANFNNVFAWGRAGPYAVQPGCDTIAYLYSEPNFGGEVRLVTGPTTVDPAVIRSVRVARTKKLLIETNKCKGCNLAGVNLSGYTLYNVELTDVDMTRANLSNAQMAGARFTNVNFEGANLSKTSFYGATFRSVGLTGTDIRQAAFSAVPDFTSTIAPDPCATGPLGDDASRFARTKATLKQLPPSIWRYLDLSEVIFDNPALAGDVSFLNADVCGSRLARASLEGWDLTGAKFDKSDLTRTVLQSVTGAGTSFRRATLAHTNLTGAVLRDASFDGAIGTDAIFANVAFTGGSMVEATMTGVQAAYASFTGFDMSRTTFEGGGSSSFYGASFTNSKLDSARLSNVSMSFTTFTGGSLIDSKLVQTSFINSVFSATSFKGANARSALFSEAAFFNVDMTDAIFAPAAAASAPASFERAMFCGDTFAATDLSSAILTGALFPMATVTLTLPAGPVTCLPVSLAGLITTSDTICPSGQKPSSISGGCAGADWTVVAPPAPPCCDPSTQRCRYLKPGFACKTDCDCQSKKCATAGVCSQ